MVAINKIIKLRRMAEVVVEAAVLHLTVQVIHGLRVIQDVHINVKE